MIESFLVNALDNLLSFFEALDKYREYFEKI